MHYRLKAIRMSDNLEMLIKFYIKQELSQKKEDLKSENNKKFILWNA